MHKVAIMQPHFLPYYGFFSLMKDVDTFIILDNVQFSKQSWQQRNKIKVGHADKWLTVPVKQSYKQLIHDVRLDDHEKLYKLKDNIKDIYELEFTQQDTLLSLNMANIMKIKKMLGIDTHILFASLLGQTDIVELTHMVGGKQYISTGGSRVYFDDELENRFLSKGITTTFNDYEADYSIIQYLDNDEYLKDRGLI